MELPASADQQLYTASPELHTHTNTWPLFFRRPKDNDDSINARAGKNAWAYARTPSSGGPSERAAAPPLTWTEMAKHRIYMYALSAWKSAHNGPSAAGFSHQLAVWFILFVTRLVVFFFSPPRKGNCLKLIPYYIMCSPWNSIGHSALWLLILLYARLVLFVCVVQEGAPS